jgi:hypothetical protein
MKMRAELTTADKRRSNGNVALKLMGLFLAMAKMDHDNNVFC